ncbi:hypothetical protein [Janibacter sp. GS2]|uniref:hypothetical protein n=1 Tax=Janibacter sp. GS2 TaxID=3442646 RepID=UPI003EBA660F
MSEGRPPGIGGVARRLGLRVKSALAPSGDSADTARSEPDTTGRTTRRDTAATKKSQLQAAQAQLEQLTTTRDELRQQRLAVQQVLGAEHGKSVQPRLKVEKTNGVPSFVVSQRMMQRIYGAAEDPRAGLDGIGATFADRAGTARFARSHAVPVLDESDVAPEAVVVAHAFKGEVALVEVRAPQGVRHFEADGTDPGDIRPAATYDPAIAQPEGFEDICAWSKTLSRHIPRPYVQVYWSATSDGPRVHHLEVDPDRIPALTPEWDKRLGLAFDGAYSRYLKQPFRRGGLANRVPGGTFTPEEIV